MAESKTITIPQKMPLIARIAEVRIQISEWMQSLDEPFRTEKDTLHLIKYGRKGQAYTFLYKIERDTVPHRNPWSTGK